MNIINRDITNITSGVIIHQVNRQGFMGAGVAKALANKFPDLERAYKTYSKNNCVRLGDWQRVDVGGEIRVLNIFGQDLNPFDAERSTRATSYDAVAYALENYTKYYPPHYYDHFAPYLMGCGLGGGEWSIYSAIVERYIPNVIWCKKD